MSIFRRLRELIQRDDLYVHGHEDPYLKRGLQNRLYITPETKIGSLPTIKKELKKAIMEKESKKE